MTKDEAINILNILKNYYNDKDVADDIGYVGFDNEDNEALDIAIKALEKQKAISELQPPTDNWETYADRLYDLAYLSGYNDGLIAKRGD